MPNSSNAAKYKLTPNKTQKPIPPTHKERNTQHNRDEQAQQRNGKHKAPGHKGGDLKPNGRRDNGKDKGCFLNGRKDGRRRGVPRTEATGPEDQQSVPC